MSGDTDAWRLVVRTEFLASVSVDDPKVRGLLLTLASYAPTYAWVFTPPEVTRKYELEGEGLVHLQSTVYLRPETASWLPEFLARMAILQPIDAQRQAEANAELLKATRHTSRPPALRRPPGTINEILGVAQDVCVPAGREISRWSGSAEFESTAQQYGRQDMCFGTGDKNGLALETPIGDTSALVRCSTESAHPALGNGRDRRYYEPQHEHAHHQLVCEACGQVDHIHDEQLGDLRTRIDVARASRSAQARSASSGSAATVERRLEPKAIEECATEVTGGRDARTLRA